MKNIGIPFNERRMITNIYWNQIEIVRYDNELTDNITIAKGVRQVILGGMIDGKRTRGRQRNIRRK